MKRQRWESLGAVMVGMRIWEVARQAGAWGAPTKGSGTWDSGFGREELQGASAWQKPLGLDGELWHPASSLAGQRGQRVWSR